MEWIRAGRPALVLAPMEGVTDAPMRALISERGGFSFCVSEFLRVSQEIPPPRVFFEHVPEFKSQCRTPSGTPVQVQLLGGDAQKMALTAARACQLGARAVDINFGCPAPTVNRHDGGATLLKYPHRIRAIVEAVRAAVPPEFPVSAKLRLGWDTLDAIDENAERAAEGGAAWITIHGRTRMQGYIPPAYWGPIGRVRQRLKIPVVANGEIWDLEDFKRCRDQTGSEHFMIGRGALGDPGLCHAIARELGVPGGEKASQSFAYSAPSDWRELFVRFVEINSLFGDRASRASVQRIKQWLRYASMRHPLPWFDTLKRLQTLDEVLAFLS